MTVEHTPDGALVDHILSGRREAFQILVERYLDTVRMVALAKTGNLADAEDVTQDTFLKAYTTLGTLRDRDKLAPWLVAIARNLAISLLRRRERERRNAPRAFRDDPVLPNHEQREFFDAVVRQVDRLPLNLREVVLLHYFEGLKCREIAERLEMNTNAVVKRLARAKGVLGDRLLREWGEGATVRGRRDESVARVMGGVALLPVPDWTAQIAAATSGGWGAGLSLGGVLASKALWIGATLLAVAAVSAVLWQTGTGGFGGTRDSTALARGASESGGATQGAGLETDAEPDSTTQGGSGGAPGTPVTGGSVTMSQEEMLRRLRDLLRTGNRSGVRYGPAAAPEDTPEEETDPEDESGEPLGYLEGRVLTQDRSSPVEGATVAAQGNQASGVAQTDAGGAFHLDLYSATAGEDTAEAPLFMVSAQKAGLVSDTLLQVPLNSSGLTLVLTDRGAVRGVALDAETGRPITTFEARISRHRLEPEGIMGSGLPWTPFQSEDGYFELPTEYDLGEIAVRAPRYRETQVTLDLPRGEVLDGLEVALRPGAAFTGIAYDALTHAPVPGASAGIAVTEVRQWWGINEQNFSIGAVTDEEGVFELTNADSGVPFDLIVWHPAYAPSFVIDLDAGYQREIRLYLTQGGQVAGTVKRNGAPIAGLRMWLGLPFGRPMEHTAAGSDRAVFLALAGTNEQGAYSFQQLPAGRYQMRVMDVNAGTPLPNRYLTRRWVDVIDGETAVVDYNIETEGSVSGYITGVTDFSTIQLRLYDRQFPEQTLYSTVERHDSAAPDAEGHFQFPPAPEGAYFIRATIPSDVPVEATVAFDIAAGQNTEVELVFDVPEETPVERTGELNDE